MRFAVIPLATPVLALALSGCMTTADATPAEPEYIEREAGSGSPCDAAPVQELVGETATAELGARILAESGAATLRWGPPDSAWTMDYRPDRVNVRFDRDMAVTAITCG